MLPVWLAAQSPDGLVSELLARRTSYLARTSGEGASTSNMKQTSRKHRRLVALVNSAMLASVATTLLLLFSAADGAHLSWRAAVIFGGLIGSAVSYFVLQNQHK